MLFAWFLAAENGAQPQGSFLQNPITLILIMLAFFFFMIIMPNRQRQKQLRAMIDSLKRNDRIINSGGIIGVVESIKKEENEVTLKGGLRLTLTSIVQVIPQEDANKESK